MRIAIGGFLHESHSFAPVPTNYADFLQPGGLPRSRGPGAARRGPRRLRPVAGAIAVAGGGRDLVPLAWCIANPAGPVQDEAFERIAALICAGAVRALDEAPLDGVYLDLHGAAVADSFPDLEGELLRRVRAIVGDVPLTISLDPHANLTRQMVDARDAAGAFPDLSARRHARGRGAGDASAAGAHRARAALGPRVPPAGLLDPDRQPMHADGADAAVMQARR